MKTAFSLACSAQRVCTSEDNLLVSLNVLCSLALLFSLLTFLPTAYSPLVSLLWLTITKSKFASLPPSDQKTIRMVKKAEEAEKPTSENG